MSKRINVWVQEFKGRKNLMLQWLDPISGDRKSKSAGTPDPEKAEKARADHEYELNNGIYSRSSDITWERFRTLFTDEYCGGLKETSRAKFDCVFDVLEQETKLVRLSVIDERFLSQFAARLRVRKQEKRHGKTKRSETEPKIGLASQTIKNYLVNIKTAMKWAADQGFIATCPKFPKILVSKKRPSQIPAETFERLMETEPDPLWRVFMCFGWWAGLRLSEVYGLRWEESDRHPWIDWRADRIVLPNPKSNQDQWVPMHPELRKMLSELPRQDEKVFPFINHRTKKPLSRSGITSHVLMIAKRAGVRLSMHKLRKGFGCRAAAMLGKGNAPILHRLMRHSSMQITMDYYANVDDSLADAMKQLS